ncbi:hypothetical protein WA158_006118 [Blastocystis sp. Blastoise]
MSGAENISEVDANCTDLRNPEVLEKYNEAAGFINKAMDGVISKLEAGKKISELCTFGDLLITRQCEIAYPKGKMEKGISFPTCLSVNNCVCHNSPYPEESTVLKAGDVVKIDMGCQLNGFCAVAAQTVVVPGAECPKADKLNDLMSAAYYMGELCEKMIANGKKNNDITPLLGKIATAYGINIIQGTLMHQMKQYVIDGNKVIIAREDPNQKVDDCTFETNEVYAVDIALSSGEGKPVQKGTRNMVYRKNVESTYLLKLKAARATLTEINKKYPIFPFSLRCLKEKTARLGLKECISHNLLIDYPILYEKESDMVVHYKFTLLLLPDGTTRITGNKIDINNFKSDKSCTDKEVLDILA